MSRFVLVDFDTERRDGRDFEVVRPIGVLLERDTEGFESLYLDEVTEGRDTGSDNYRRTMEAVDEFRTKWDTGQPVEITVGQLFTYLSVGSYLGLRYRTVGMLDDGVTIEEAFQTYVVDREPLPELREGEELPQI